MTRETAQELADLATEVATFGLTLGSTERIRLARREAITALFREAARESAEPDKEIDRLRGKVQQLTRQNTRLRKACDSWVQRAKVAEAKVDKQVAVYSKVRDALIDNVSEEAAKAEIECAMRAADMVAEKPHRGSCWRAAASIYNKLREAGIIQPPPDEIGGHFYGTGQHEKAMGLMLPYVEGVAAPAVSNERILMCARDLLTNIHLPWNADRPYTQAVQSMHRSFGAGKFPEVSDDDELRAQKQAGIDEGGKQEDWRKARLERAEAAQGKCQACGNHADGCICRTGMEKCHACGRIGARRFTSGQLYCEDCFPAGRITPPNTRTDLPSEPVYDPVGAAAAEITAQANLTGILIRRRGDDLADICEEVIRRHFDPPAHKGPVEDLEQIVAQLQALVVKQPMRNDAASPKEVGAVGLSRVLHHPIGDIKKSVLDGICDLRQRWGSKGDVAVIKAWAADAADYLYAELNSPRSKLEPIDSVQLQDLKDYDECRAALVELSKVCTHTEVDGQGGILRMLRELAWMNHEDSSHSQIARSVTVQRRADKTEKWAKATLAQLMAALDRAKKAIGPT